MDNNKVIANFKVQILGGAGEEILASSIEEQCRIDKKERFFVLVIQAQATEDLGSIELFNAKFKDCTSIRILNMEGKVISNITDYIHLYLSSKQFRPDGTILYTIDLTKTIRE